MSRNMPELETQVKLDATVAQVPFEVQMANMAASPSALGQFGAQVAMSASQAIQARRGYQAGMEPSGDTLPPLTKADEMYNKAYIAQSQNTLGLQANQMLQKGALEMGKLYRLTPGAISEYTKQMSVGMEEILKNAPFEARQNLEPQIAAKMASNISSYTSRMQSQQKTEQVQTMSLKNKDDIQTAYEMGISGNEEVAQSLYNGAIERITQMREGGMISPVQEAAQKKAALISYLSGVESGKALTAFKDKDVDQYLADFMDRKPSGVSTEDWEHVAKNVVNEIGFQETLHRRNEESLYSEAYRMLHEGTITPDFLTQLEAESTSKSRFNTFMGQVYSYNSKRHSSHTSAQELAANFTNAEAYSRAKPNDLDSALAVATQDIMTRSENMGRPMEASQAEVQAMRSAAGPIPSFTKKMNAYFTSANPALMDEALNAFQVLHAQNPRAVMNLSKDAVGMKAKYEQFLNAGDAPDVAAQKAQQIVLQKDKNQIDINNEYRREWIKKNFKTPSQKTAFAKEFIHEGDISNTNDLMAFSNKVQSMFLDNMNIVNNDAEAAKKMTAEGIAISYGASSVNGDNQFTFLPIEQQLKLSPEAAPVVREDIYNQIRQQIAYQKEIFDNSEKSGDHRVSFYYRLPERQTFESYLEGGPVRREVSGTSGLARYAANLSPREEFSTLSDQEKSAQTQAYDSPLYIEQVFRDGSVKRFKLEVEANAGMAIDDRGLVGKYSYKLRPENGAQTPMYGFFSGGAQSAFYLPNAEFIGTRAGAFLERKNRVSIAQLRAREQLKKEGLPDARMAFLRGLQ